jgi:probable F420-dependent oxidoreductase
VLRSIVFGTDAFAELIPVAQGAERAGFHRLWTTEYTGRDSVIRALLLANATERIGVATGIAYAFSRAPLAMAAMAADAYVASGGRFALGLGAGTRGMRTRWYETEFDHPAPRLADYVGLMRATWAAGSGGLDYQGKFYHLRIPAFRAGHPADELAGLRVYGSGLNAVMLREAARSCDGIALHPLAGSERYLGDVALPAIRAGHQQAGRQRGRSLAIWLITSIDDDAAVARQRAKLSLAFYFSTPSYRSITQNTPWAAATEAIRAGFLDEGANWASLSRLVPDEMVDEFALAGTPGEVRDRLGAHERRFGLAGADEIVFQTVGENLTREQVARNCGQIVEVLRPD